MLSRHLIATGLLAVPLLLAQCSTEPPSETSISPRAPSPPENRDASSQAPFLAPGPPATAPKCDDASREPYPLNRELVRLATRKPEVPYPSMSRGAWGKLRPGVVL